MNKEILTKISSPDTALDVTDMTPEEKRSLYAFFEQQGASQGFTYDRFFKEGFSIWELLGINQIKIEYLYYLHTEEKVEISVRNEGNEPLYYYKPKATTEAVPDGVTTADIEERRFSLTTPGDFWRFLGDVRKRSHFSARMMGYGMMSAVTVARRFSTDNWKPFETTGIIQLTQDFIKQQQS